MARPHVSPSPAANAAGRETGFGEDPPPRRNQPFSEPQTQSPRFPPRSPPRGTGIRFRSLIPNFAGCLRRETEISLLGENAPLLKVQ